MLRSIKLTAVLLLTLLSAVWTPTLSIAAEKENMPDLERRVADLLKQMTLEEKVGQMVQTNASEGTIPDELRAAVQAGRVGSLLNEVDVEVVNELQRIAVEESRLGVPLLFGRDVIHGFKTIFPIPLGLAATWNPGLVREGARIAALEAAASGVNWTFAPMLDVARDPRWGRIAESFGEDVLLNSVFGAAMVEGFQGDDLAAAGTIAACAKHFAGYGASEGGRDYNVTNLSENELRNVYLRPFRAAVDAGAATIMASYSDLDGVPASANAFLMQQVLRDEWGFGGFVVSDWESVVQLMIHGLAPNEKEAAYEAVTAGVNMEMASTTYHDHLAALVESGRVSVERLDEMVAGILRVKLQLGLFERPYADPAGLPRPGNPGHLEKAREAAVQSLVLLENDGGVLPLDLGRTGSLAVIGPLADDEYEQLGSWVFDGDLSLSRTPLAAIRERAGDAVAVRYVRAMETSRSRSTDGFGEAVAAAEASDAVIAFMGEEAFLSGEAHSRADIGLPGNQAELLHRLKKTGKPLVVVVLAGRPLTLGNIEDAADAILFAWQPGTMAGPAITDVLFGDESPSGKLPVTFPSVVGQVPIYYAHKNTGKPPTAEAFQHIDDLVPRTKQYATGMESHYLDAGYKPRYPFGYGLSYTTFSYSSIEASPSVAPLGETVTLRAVVRNDGAREAEEVVQLYVRDLAGNVTRPVRELKGFQRVRLKPGESRAVEFTLGPDDLAFYGRDMKRITEAGAFHAWIGGRSDTELRTEFSLTGPNAGESD